MLYKRSSKPGSHWWVRFSVKGEEVRQSSGTDRKEAAEAFEQDLRHEIWNQKYRGIEEGHTWEEACQRWLKEKVHKRSIARDRQAIVTLAISAGLDLAALTSTAGAGSGARELACLRSILNACVKWGWLDKAPKIEMPHAEKHEPRWVTRKKFNDLARRLPRHASELARFAVATGLRSYNCRALRWDHVSLSKQHLWVAAEDAKGRRGIGIPLSADAMAVLHRQRGLHTEFVFTDHAGKAPIGSIKTTWLKAVKRAGLEGFRFHDLRHTWAVWHTLAGTPPIVLKELGGWSSLVMVERYAHLNPGHLADWAGNSSTKTGTRRKRKKRKSRRK